MDKLLIIITAVLFTAVISVCRWLERKKRLKRLIEDVQRYIDENMEEDTKEDDN